LMDKPEDRFSSAEQTLAMLDAAAAASRTSAFYPSAWGGGSRGGAPESSGIGEVHGGAWNASGDVGPSEELLAVAASEKA
jgi:hypothetical protein